MSSPSSAAENLNKTITLRSCDGRLFEVDETVAAQMQLIKRMREDPFSDDGTCDFHIVRGEILSKVIDYCRRHTEAAASAVSAEELKAFDANFVQVNRTTLFGINCAFYVVRIELIWC